MDKEYEIKYPNLVSEMARKGITQRKLAKVLGIGKSTISRKFSGKNDWTLSEVKSICEYLNKDYYQLFIKRK